MSPISFILPVLTVVSLFLYVFSAERAWLPKMGTTEWITRAFTPRRMTTDIKLKFSWKDIVIFFGIVVVYVALHFYKFTTASFEFTRIIFSAVFIAIIYIFAKLLYKNRVTAFFAAAMTAADIFPVSYDYIEATCAVILFVFFILIAADNIWAFIPAGIFLSVAAFYYAIYALFALLALCPAVVTSVKTKNGKSALLYIIFCAVLPAVSCYFSPFFNIAFISIGPSFIYFQPFYLFVTAVCLIITVIHLFRDKSYTALFISTGLIISLICEFFSVHITPVFTGLAIAYPASIIIQRGKKRHKIFCIIFGSVMVLAFLAVVAYYALSVFSLPASDILLDAVSFICPLIKLIS